MAQPLTYSPGLTTQGILAALPCVTSANQPETGDFHAFKHLSVEHSVDEIKRDGD